MPEHESAIPNRQWDIRAMRVEVQDLFEPKAQIYFLDLLLSLGLGWGAFATALHQPMYSSPFWFFLVVSSFPLYRAISFTHEMVHLRKTALPGFKLLWTACCGIPLLVPNFLYAGVHIAHHSKHKYGTLQDGEYMPFAYSPVSLILGHMISNLVLPIFTLARFAILGPLSFLSAPARNWIMENASAMSLRFPFKRELPSRSADQISWLKEEIATSIFLWATLLAIYVGIFPSQLLIQYIAVIIMIATLNSLRAVGATHRYHGQGEEFSFHHQFTDSVNVDSQRWDSLLLCPVGLRYHALHHLFPSMPYHNLGEGHQRLSQTLPQEADYHQASISSIWHGWHQLLHDIDQHGGTANLPTTKPQK